MERYISIIVNKKPPANTFTEGFDTQKNKPMV